MVLEREPGRGQVREIARAGLNLEYTLTLPALKVMMVMPVRQFEAWILTRQVDRAQFAIVDQTAQIAVDGCKTEPGHRALRSNEHLLRQQRAA